MIKNNFLLAVLFLFLTTSFAQKVAVFQSKKDTITTANNLMVDVSDSISKVFYQNNFQQKYKTSDFIYTQKKTNFVSFSTFYDVAFAKIGKFI